MILRKLETTIPQSGISPVKAALFAAVPGETHFIGVRMAADIFRREGWDIDLCIGFSADELVARVLQRDYRIVGLSCSGTPSIEPLRQLVVSLRRDIPDLDILLSGQVLDHNSASIENLEVDETAGDIMQSLTAMNKFLIAV